MIGEALLAVIEIFQIKLLLDCFFTNKSFLTLLIFHIPIYFYPKRREQPVRINNAKIPSVDDIVCSQYLDKVYACYLAQTVICLGGLGVRPPQHCQKYCSRDYLKTKLFFFASDSLGGYISDASLLHA